MEPPSPGTAKDCWQETPVCHPALALPGLSGKSHPALALPEKTGKNHPYATQLWHCQCFLAFGVFSPLGIGTAKDYWRGAPTGHSGLALPGNPGSLAPVRPRVPHVAFCKLQRRLRQLQREPYRDASTVNP